MGIVRHAWQLLAIIFGVWAGSLALPSRAATSPVIAPDFINFGYVQNTSVLPYIQYETFTHIAPPFVDFNGNGALTGATVSGFSNRDADLRAGGAAQRAGTKIIMCVRNQAFNETILAQVMQDPSRRTILVNAVANLVNNDAYCAGVNFDFEFSWNTTTRNGITAFLQEMRSAIPNKEMSVYTHAIYNSNMWNFPAIVTVVDYIVYSTYDFGTSTAHAIADYDRVIQELGRHMDAGVPPSKLVLTWVTYGRRFYSAGNIDYDVPGAVPNGKQSQGFYDTVFNTTLRQAHGGPFTPTYRRGDETVYYKYQQVHPATDVLTNFVAVGDTPESLEIKINAARSFPGYQGRYGGEKLAGVGWWSMMWVSNYWRDYNFSNGYEFGSAFNGFDPITNAKVSRAPYYRHVDLLVQELLKKPGQTSFNLESFEAANPHWRAPHVSPDSSGDTDKDSAFYWIPAPAGAGRPASTGNAGRMSFDFENSTGNKLFLRYELLNNAIETGIIDTPSALALVNRNTRFTGYYHVNGNYSARTLRLAVLDGQRQVEVSKPITLPSAAGWHQFLWDINDPAQVEGWTTAEPNFVSGNGVVDSANPLQRDARDVSFLGFILEGGSAGSGLITFDELRYEATAPEGKQYVINEFRYGAANAEFVEISGPPGAIPSAMQLISYNSSDATVYKSTPLGGREIPANGILVLGDIGVPGASGASGFTPAGWSSVLSDLPPTLPGSLQLYDSNSGFVHDSVVYGAYAGVGELDRTQARRVTGEGYGWMGNLGNGTDAAGQRYSMGRTPSGTDTNWNQRDFSFMPATPGAPNHVSELIGSDDTYDFEIVPPGAFQSYQTMQLVNPVSAGLPASPGGGKAYRAVDTTGGGVIGIFGDAQMGADRGVEITGNLYIPASNAPAQAIAVGFCGTMGSTFFHPQPTGSGYEDGYWLIYENGIVGLNDGQPDHPGSFQLVMATNDNADRQPTLALGGLVSAASLNVTPGSWTSFRLRVDPTAVSAQQLFVQIDNQDVYRGPVPEGGPTKGAFQVGFRETMNGVLSSEGTWIDDLKIDYATPPARVTDYHLY